MFTGLLNNPKFGQRDKVAADTRIGETAMTVQSMSFIFGALLLAVAILGGGFEVKEIKVSNVSIGVRFVAGIVGLCFIALGSGALGFLQLPGASPEPPSEPPPVSPVPGLPRTVSPSEPKPPEALVAEEIPFISDHDRSDVSTLYLAAPDHKALAISHSRMRMITGQADVETAKNGALDNCRKALEAAQIGGTCDLYAVGNMVVYQRGHPPMPTPPWFRTDPSIAQPFNAKDVPLVSEDARQLMEKNYLGLRKSKALALSPQSHVFRYFAQLSQDEAARRALELCGDVAGIPCMIIAVDDEFVVPIPTTMKPVGFFQPAGNALIAPGSRDQVARRLATKTNGWSAVATGADGLVGMALNASDEQKAIEGALADCSSHDRGCRVIAIGPFSVVAAEVGKSP